MRAIERARRSATVARDSRPFAGAWIETCFRNGPKRTTPVATGRAGFMTRDAFVASLEGFAAQNHLPVETGTAVTDLARDEVRGAYRLDTPSGPMWAHNVVIASGSLNCPRRPPAAAALPPRLVQFDAAAYRNPAALPAGAVLVVGSAQCGGQIAEDLVETGRTVFLATGRVGRFPRRYRGYDTILWLVAQRALRRAAQGLCGGFRPHPGAAAARGGSHNQPAVTQRTRCRAPRPLHRG